MTVEDDVSEGRQWCGWRVWGWIGMSGCVVGGEAAFGCEEVAWVLCALMVCAREDVDVVADGVIKEMEGVFVAVTL